VWTKCDAGASTSRSYHVPPGTRRSSPICSFFFQAEDGIRDRNVTGVQTCALPISVVHPSTAGHHPASDTNQLEPGSNRIAGHSRSEERRVGKEGGARGGGGRRRKKEQGVDGRDTCGAEEDEHE